MATISGPTRRIPTNMSPCGRVTPTRPSPTMARQCLKENGILPVSTTLENPHKKGRAIDTRIAAKGNGGIYSSATLLTTARIPEEVSIATMIDAEQT